MSVCTGMRVLANTGVPPMISGSREMTGSTIVGMYALRIPAATEDREVQGVGDALSSPARRGGGRSELVGESVCLLQTSQPPPPHSAWSPSPTSWGRKSAALFDRLRVDRR